jgi:hypothetical protein
MCESMLVLVKTCRQSGEAVFQLFARLQRFFLPADGNLGSTAMTENKISTSDPRPIRKNRTVYLLQKGESSPRR